MGTTKIRPRSDCIKFSSDFNLTEFFLYWYVWSTPGEHKPHAKPFALLCSLLEVHPKECVIVGDTSDDIRSGIGAGL